MTPKCVLWQLVKTDEMLHNRINIIVRERNTFILKYDLWPLNVYDGPSCMHLLVFIPDERIAPYIKGICRSGNNVL